MVEENSALVGVLQVGAAFLRLVGEKGGRGGGWRGRGAALVLEEGCGARMLLGKGGDATPLLATMAGGTEVL